MASNIEIGQRILSCRRRKELTLQEVGNKIGVASSTIQRYEAGKVEKIKLPVIEAIAGALEVSADYILGKSNNPFLEKTSSPVFDIPFILPLPKTKKIPLLGEIACGEPILAEENIEEFIEAPENLKADFCLRCKGESMTGARIFDGDLVFIHKQPIVENGEIAAVLIDNEATLKRVYRYKQKLILQPENPAFEPFVYIGEEMNQIEILGKAIAFLSSVR